MIAETEAYKLLVADEELNKLFDQFRGKEFPGYKQGIFTYDIPEKPTNLKRKELAPLARIYSTSQWNNASQSIFGAKTLNKRIRLLKEWMRYLKVVDLNATQLMRNLDTWMTILDC